MQYPVCIPRIVIILDFLLLLYRGNRFPYIIKIIKIINNDDYFGYHFGFFNLINSIYDLGNLTYLQ